MIHSLLITSYLCRRFKLYSIVLLTFIVDVIVDVIVSLVSSRSFNVTADVEKSVMSIIWSYLIWRTYLIFLFFDRLYDALKEVETVENSVRGLSDTDAPSLNALIPTKMTHTVEENLGTGAENAVPVMGFSQQKSSFRSSFSRYVI